RALAKSREHAQRVGGSATGLLDAARVGVEKIDEPTRGLHGAARGLLHAFEEEIDPRVPVASGAHPVEQVVIDWSMFLEIEREVEQRLGEQPAVVQQERDEQTP